MSRIRDGIIIAAGLLLAAAILAIDAREEEGAPPTAAPLVVDAGDAVQGRAPTLRPYLGKPRPPVRVRVLESAPLEAGVPGSVTIEVSSSADVKGLSLRLAGEEGIYLARPTGVPIPDLDRGRTEVVELPLTPESGGPHRLSGVVEFELDGQRMAMPVVLSLRVAGPVTAFPVSSKPERGPQRDATGELVYPLPAN